MKEEIVDVAIVGAGAAGLMSAIWVGRTAHAKGACLQILLLDSTAKIGAKILMSGGTRCNVTNREVLPSDYTGGPAHFIRHVLAAFTPKETTTFFQEIGVALELESTGKYFPTTHSARTVLNALMHEAERVSVHLERSVCVTGIQKEGSLFHLSGPDLSFKMLARKVVLTTGGLSYPETGSDGTGYRLAETFGHKLTPRFPSLTPFLSVDKDWRSLSGISIEAKLSLFKRSKKTHETKGAFLFTHFGFSGPVVLDMSRHYATIKSEEDPSVEVSFLPTLNDEVLQSVFGSWQNDKPGKQVKNLLHEALALPSRFVEVLFHKMKISSEQLIGKLSREDRKQLVRSLLRYPLEVTGLYGYQKAEVTAGGVCLREVKPQTMESKLIEGLYFAGEMLDVDGRIGGFNFQWAWSTGAISGKNACST